MDDQSFLVYTAWQILFGFLFIVEVILNIKDTKID